MRFSLPLASVALLSSLAVAQEPGSLSTTGKLESASCSSSAFNTGGTITVNGYTITIPENLIFQLPAAWIPFKDICAGGFEGNEVDVFGNIVNGKAIAGIVSMSQLLLQGGTGYIESIDGASGTMKIKGGPTLRINDPNGVYGKAYTDKPAFTADDENPSITAFSGFPMCIPRSGTDDLCPSSNRPSGQRTFDAPDPLVMAPFIVGDYLEFSGISVGGEVICYAIVAINVQIQSSNPVYIRIEDAIIGVYDGDANSEFGDTRFIGYLSDSSASVTISAIDVDRCTGEENDRIVGSAQIKAGDVRNKFTWRADSTTLAKYTREYRIKASTGTKETKNKIIAGQYVQPVTEWIFPELLTPGLNPPALDFTGMTNLVNGIVQDDQQFGQLNPWPGASAPSAPSKCTVQPDPVTSTAPSDGATFAPLATPAARVPANFTHIPGSVVTLSGSNNASDIPEGNLTYSWTQVSGPTVTLVGADKAKCSFTAAAQAAATPTQKREFKLTVSQRTDLNVNDTAIVAATGDRSVKDVVSIDSYTTTNSQGGTISVTAHSNVVVDASAALKLFLGTSTTALTMTSQGGGVFSYSARSVKKPASIRTTSVYGGSATTMATTSKRRREFSIGSEQGMVSRIKRGVFDWRS